MRPCSCSASPPEPLSAHPLLAPSPQAMSHDIEYSEKYADEDYEYRRRSRAATRHRFWQLPRTPCVRAIRRRARARRHVILPKHIAKTMTKGRLLLETEWRGLGVTQSRGWGHYAIHKCARARARGSATVACLALTPLARRASGRSRTSSSSAGQTTQTPSPASLLEASASTRPARSSTDDRRPSSPVSLPPPRPDT